MYNYESNPIVLKVRAIKWTGENKEQVNKFLWELSGANYDFDEEGLWLPSFRGEIAQRELVPIGSYVRTVPAAPDEAVYESEEKFLKMYHLVNAG